MGSMSYPQDLFDELSRHPWAKQHADNYPIQEVLNLVHALSAVVEPRLDTLVSLSADCFVNAQTLVRFRGEFFYISHFIRLSALEALPPLEWLE